MQVWRIGGGKAAALRDWYSLLVVWDACPRLQESERPPSTNSSGRLQRNLEPALRMDLTAVLPKLHPSDLSFATKQTPSPNLSITLTQVSHPLSQNLWDYNKNLSVWGWTSKRKKKSNTRKTPVFQFGDNIKNKCFFYFATKHTDSKAFLIQNFITLVKENYLL